MGHARAVTNAAQTFCVLYFLLFTSSELIAILRFLFKLMHEPLCRWLLYG